MTPTALPRILRLPRQTDSESDSTAFILVHVSAGGSRSLDVKLLGTDDEAVYDAKLKQTQTPSLRVRNAPCDEQAWDRILKHVLLGNPSDSADEDLKGIEVVARIEKRTLTIVIQKRIQEIIQRLGSLELVKRSSKESVDDVDLLEWCSIAISKSQASAVDSSRLHEELQEHRDRVMQLEKCLTELTQHKIAHEKVMLDKFTLLLNEKKLKIRDQQRLLASAKVDPEKLAAVEASRKSRKAGPSRGNKRKAAQKDESEESEGHEKMDVDAPVAASVAENAQSSAGETTTGAESDDDDDERVTLPTRAAPDAAELSSPKHQEEVSKSVAPPKRALPFTKKTAVAASTTNRPASETDSDDEL